MPSSLLSSQRSDNLEWIAASLALLVSYIKGENMRGYLDVNKLSEDFFSTILNLTYGLELENLNKKQKMNIKAIDLGDDKNRIAYQVTSENNRDKVRTTLKKFTPNGKYDRIKFMILDTTKPTTSIKDLSGGSDYSFDPETDVISVKDLAIAIEAIKDDGRIADLYKYIKNQVPLLSLLLEENIDKEIIDVVGDIIDRSVSEKTRTVDLNFVEVNDKIIINFETEEDREYVRSGYSRCMDRFDVIEDVIRSKGSNGEIVLQSSMSDLYNKLKKDNIELTNRGILDKMIDLVEKSIPSGEYGAARRLAVKSLVIFHFDDCTIFEKTALEKTQTVFGTLA